MLKALTVLFPHREAVKVQLTTVKMYPQPPQHETRTFLVCQLKIYTTTSLLYGRIHCPSYGEYCEVIMIAHEGCSPESAIIIPEIVSTTWT